MKVETYKCDVCPKMKGDVNHWWLIFNTQGFITVKPWSEYQAVHADVHACGAECVQKKVNEFMEKAQ